MVKLIGLVLILFAGTAIGYLQAAKYANRPRHIRQLIHALRRLETDIHYGFTPLTDALMGIGTHSTSPIAGLFLLAAYKLNNMPHESAKTSWRSAIEEYWPATALGLNEQEILYRFGDTLGISDRDDQVKHLKLAVAQLQAEEDQAWDEQRKYERLCRALGVLSSILVIIIIY